MCLNTDARIKQVQTPKESLRLPTGHTFFFILPNLVHQSNPEGWR